jgi:hypothetical protein
MRVTSEAAPLYSTSSGMDPLSPRPEFGRWRHPSFGDKPNDVCPMNIETWGDVDRARRRNMRIDNPEKEAPTKRICESSCSLFAGGEHCPWYERETPGLLYRPATWISVCLSLSTCRCVSKSGNRIFIRDRGSNVRGSTHSRTKACRERHRHVRTLCK